MEKNSLFKEELMWLGITEVSEDGEHIFIGDRELSQSVNGMGYKKVTICPSNKNNLEKQRILRVHRIVYAWHKGPIPPTMCVDHISGDTFDNSIENLRLVTEKENRNAFRTKNGTKERACSLKTPREEYEKRIAKYEKELKTTESASRKSSLQSMIGALKANLRYYDSHIEEYLKEQETKEETKKLVQEAQAKKKEAAECKQKLRFIATEYRLRGDKQSWHQFMGLINNFDVLPLEKLKDIADKTFDKLAN